MTQKNAIRRHLNYGLPLTPMTALKKFGCFRLAARIHELVSEGLPVKQKMIIDPNTQKRYAQYQVELSEILKHGDINN